jgi:hypothetical protein
MKPETTMETIFDIMQTAILAIAPTVVVVLAALISIF